MGNFCFYSNCDNYRNEQVWEAHQGRKMRLSAATGNHIIEPACILTAGGDFPSPCTLNMVNEPCITFTYKIA